MAQEQKLPHLHHVKAHEAANPRWRQREFWLFAVPFLLLLILGWLYFNSTPTSKQASQSLFAPYIGPVTFSSDSKLLAGAQGQTTAQLWIWNLQTGKVLRTVNTEHNGGVGLIAFSPDSKLVATCDAHDGERIFVWEVNTGAKLTQLAGEQNVMSSLFYSPDGKFLVNAGYGRVEVWDAGTSQLLYRLQEDKGRVFASMMPDGKTFLTTSWNATNIRDLTTGRTLHTVFTSNSQREYLKAALSSDGKTLALCTRLSQGGAETTELWDVPTGKLRHSWQENAGNKKGPWRGAVQALSFSPDSELLSSSSKGEPVRLWDVQSGSRRATLKAEAQSLAFSPDGKTLAVGTQREVQLWKVDALLKQGSQ